MHKKTILFLGVAVAVLFLTNAVFGPVSITKAANSPVTGYAWSDNIGWIQMNPAFGGAQVDDITGIFSGYAWSDNIGWINFAPASGFPETPNESAKLNLSTGQITGWVKALAASGSGGWDGWIKMRGGTGSTIICPSGYIYNQVTLKCESNFTYICPSGYTYNSSNDKCENNPVCPSGGSYNTTNNRCEAGLISTPVTQYRCPITGTAYGDSGSCNANCYTMVSCNPVSTDTYYWYPNEEPGSLQCTEVSRQLESISCSGTCPIPSSGGKSYGSRPPGSVCIGWVFCGLMPSCDSTVPAGFFGFGNNAYYKTTSTTYSSCPSYQSCNAETTTTYSCPSGYSQSGSICVASATCSSGGTLNGTTDKCEISSTKSCPSGGSYNSSTGKCEATPTYDDSGAGQPYGVDANLATGVFSGYAWGSDVVGWVAFSGVTMNPFAPAVVISASPNPVDYNTSSTLTWSSTNVTSCVASGDWSGDKATFGTESTGNLTSAKTYTITCAGPGGSAENSVTVNVNGPACNNNGTCEAEFGETNENCPNDCPASPSADFSLNNSNAIFASLVGGASSVSTETTITLIPSGTFTNDVALSVDSVNPALSGATFNFADSSLSSAEYSGGTKFSVNVPSGFSSGLYTITIKGDGGGLIRTVNIQLNIEAVEPSWIEI